MKQHTFVKLDPSFYNILLEDSSWLSVISVQTLLLIHHTDYNHQTSVYVTQTPKSSSVQLGNTVTLQCSFLTKNKESMYWFRAGSGQSHATIIYTHRNYSQKQERRRCVHSLSKTIQNSSDAGIYYCAVVTCGEIVFGEGTQVETRQKWDPVIIVLGTLLALCVIVIAVLILSRD
uniref:Ig-like domain-containing protein n=1 Tax=Astatotilapia calliptera TaxID=8154 RepID=A0A3P8P752_ASTCA